jgi:predicted dehydrogenase
MKKTQIGMIGCGNIAPAYIRGCRPFEFLELAFCADEDHARAEAFALKYGLTALPVEELLAAPSIEAVVNLTVPLAHSDVTLTALQAGKHVYSEKPLAVTWAAGQEVLRTAEERGLLVGCAPDTFLGGGLQTCRKVIDDGLIGTPIAAAAFMANHGPESWHPNPFFFYQVGGGPLLDMGPYYLTALIHLLGPVMSVSARARITSPTRTATSQEQFGVAIPVEVPTHVTGTLDFESGAVATFIISFDIWHADLPRIEIYGTEGTLNIPDPNTFGGPVRLRRSGDDDWTEQPLSHSETVDRGVGLADLVSAIQTGRTPRASGQLAGHVLEIMDAIPASSAQQAQVKIITHPARPQPLPLSDLSGKVVF